jgi:outer membrane protein insertion porin family
VRGFQLDRLGVSEVLNPDGLSDGGNAMIVLNAEIRMHVGRLFRRDLGVVGFMDGGNVFDRVGDLDLSRLRGTSGFGLRYDSPFGPLRLDVGYKWKRLIFTGGRERGWELYFSIGEAF